METNKELMRAEFEAAYGPKEGFAWLNPDNTYKSQAIQDGWEIWQKAWQACAALSQRPTDDKLWDETLRDRDHNAEMADKLADAIGAYFGADVGEHSNANCTWHEALRVIEEADEYRPAPAPSAAAGEQVPYGYVARANDGHETYFKDRPTGFEKPMWEGLMTVVPLYDKKETPAWDTDATTRLRSIVDLLGLQPYVPHDGLAGYEFAVLGFVRREIERLKAAAQPTPAQGDAVPVGDPDCNYAMPAGRVGNKCGRIHRGNGGKHA